MAHCYICDGGIDEPKIDPRDGKIRPCSVCEDVVQETLEGYRAVEAYEEEDENKSLEEYLKDNETSA